MIFSLFFRNFIKAPILNSTSVEMNRFHSTIFIPFVLAHFTSQYYRTLFKFRYSTIPTKYTRSQGCNFSQECAFNIAESKYSAWAAILMRPSCGTILWRSSWGTIVGRSSCGALFWGDLHGALAWVDPTWRYYNCGHSMEGRPPLEASIRIGCWRKCYSMKYVFMFVRRIR